MITDTSLDFLHRIEYDFIYRHSSADIFADTHVYEDAAKCMFNAVFNPKKNGKINTSNLGFDRRDDLIKPEVFPTAESLCLPAYTILKKQLAAFRSNEIYRSRKEYRIYMGNRGAMGIQERVGADEAIISRKFSSHKETRNSQIEFPHIF